MARIFPNPSSPTSNLLNLHAAAADIFHALFTLILVLTSAAIILSLCASHTSRKRLRSSSSTTLPKPKPISTTPSPASSPPPQSFAFTAPLVDQPLPPPPIHQALQAKQNSFALSKPGGGGGIGGNIVEGGRQYDQMTGTGRRKLLVSLSQKLSRNWTRKEGGAGGGGGGGRIRGRTQSTAFDEGDLLWKKQIILGEKCRVPDENELLGDDHGDLHQRGGGAVINKFPVYRPRTPRSLPVSRTNSHIDLASLEFLKDLNKDVN